MTLQQIMSPLRKAIEDYNMIKEGDKIAVGLSGGKDSVALLTALNGLKRFYPVNFTLGAILVDTGVNYDKKELLAVKKYCKSLGVKLHIEKTQIFQVVFEERLEKNPCSLCANMRRGALNSAAKRLGYNKVALGHHQDDLTETFMLSLLYEGRISTFNPVTYLERADIYIIRPMIYIREKDIFSFTKDLPLLKNPCPVDKTTKREYVKNLLKDIKKDVPCLYTSLFTAITHPERVNLPTKNNEKE